MYWGADGSKDLLLGRSDGRVMVYTNVGSDESPTFDGGVHLQVGPVGSKVDIDVGSRACPTVVDWDSDGRRDLVSGAYDGLIHVFINTGTDAEPDFETETYALDSGANLDVPSNRSSPHVEDLDDDGKKDLLSGNTNGEIAFYSNTGSDAAPSFSGYEFLEADSVKIDLSGTPRSRPFVCDWNSDGEKDLLLGASDGLVRLYLGIEHDTGIDDWDGEAVAGEPAFLRLLPPRPNPATSTSLIAFELLERNRVSVALYDLSGRRVAALAEREFSAGRHEIVWPGSSSRGVELPSGVYFVRAEAPGQLRTEKLVLVR